ncbi:MAG: NADH-quinone oxidoreductase subunit N [Polyangia bacterium]|jgi:NADH-quinone oxidoreductase subunit N
MLDNFQSLGYFLPEIILSVAVLAIITIDVIAGRPSLKRSAGITLGALGLAFVAVLVKWNGDAAFGLFGGLIAKDPMGDFFALFFIVATAIVGISAMRSKDAIDYTTGKESGEFYTLMMTTTIGMFLMATATDLLIAFLSLEMVSIMSYILSGFKRRNRASSEASLKYVIYGGVASGVMLYGMSLLYGLAGSTNMAVVRAACASTSATDTVVFAVILCLAGFGYKIASVPFHMWCPDVYQGAPTPVTAFLSVGPKAAGFALLIRFFSGAIPGEIGHGLTSTMPWPLLLAVIACATMTLGNLAALGQTNMKRLLAYSSIAHAGYLLLGLCAGGHDGNFAILIYLVTYLFMNIGAFVVILAIADAGGGEELLDYRGLGKRAPLAALTMAFFLFSLTGIPPFAGFFGKYFIFASLISKGGSLMVTIAVIGVINSAISLFYYARVLKAMYFEGSVEGAPAIKLPSIHSMTMIAMAVPTLLMFLVWGPVMQFVETAMVQWIPAVSHVAPLVHTALLP